MSEIPEWFETALSWQPDQGTIDVDGASICFRYWGDPGERDLLLVHGGAAHSRWWDHIAPLLATKGRVAALDLSGHGDSDHRAAYSIEQWGAEIQAVGRASGLVAPTIIAHSMGGLITLKLLGDASSGVTQAIIVDSPIGAVVANVSPEDDDLVAHRQRLYASAEQILSRFRAVPAQSSLPFVFDHIARHSIREVVGGWTWKFDGALFANRTGFGSDVPRTDGRLAFFRGEHGLVPPSGQHIVEAAGGIFIEIPTAGHAPMLDQPLALVTGIRTVLAGWDALEQ